VTAALGEKGFGVLTLLVIPAIDILLRDDGRPLTT
jgi:hypothetical protein